MRFGVSLFPLRPSQMVEVARTAESLGFDSVWLGEHVISPDRFDSRYPYHDGTDDAPAFHSKLPFYDPYAALGYVAAVTNTVKLVLSVSIVPLHDPYHLARSVMTIDHFSNGRFVFGIGTGWLREEFDIVGAPWDRRGARTEEMLELMKRLWTEPTIEHHGEFYDLPPSGMEPKPIVQPHPPYVFGGSSTVALRRAARLGDGWFGVGLDVDEAATVVARLRELRADAGRPDPLEISINWPWPLTDELVDALSAAGVDRLVVRPWERGRDAVDRLVALAHQLSIPAPT